MNSIGTLIDDAINIHVEEALDNHRLIYTWIDPKDEVQKFACKCDRQNPFPRKEFNKHIKEMLIIHAI